MPEPSAAEAAGGVATREAAAVWAGAAGAGWAGACGSAANALDELSGMSSRQAAKLIVRDIFRFFHRTAGVTSRTWRLRVHGHGGAGLGARRTRPRGGRAPSAIVTLLLRLSACA